MRILFTLVLLFSGLISIHAQTCANRAIDFDGTSDYLQSATAPVTGNANFTMEARFLCNSTGTAFRRLLSMGGTSTRVEIGEVNGRLAFMRLSSAGTAGPLLVTSTVIRNTGWHHVAVRRNNDNITIFLNCDSVYTATMPGTLNISTFRVGSPAVTTTGTVWWDGLIDEVRVWSTVRTAAQISAACSCSLSGNESGLLLFYDFDQTGIIPGGNNAGQTTVQDGTVNDNDGALNTFALTGSTSNWMCGDTSFTDCTSNCLAAFTYQDSCNTLIFSNQTQQPIPPPYTYAWDFNNDGTTDSTNPNPEWTPPGPGTYTVCLSLMTPNGAFCSTCQTITWLGDTQPPVAICALPFSVQIPAGGFVPVTVGMIDNGSFDFCGLQNVQINTSGFSCADACGPNGPIGNHVVVLTATDFNGNTATCSTLVNVADLLPPTARCKDVNISINGAPFVVLQSSDVNDGSFDNCQILSMDLSQDTFYCPQPCPMTSTVLLTATDCSGNIGTCTATVTVHDVLPPSITCPPNMTLSCDAPVDPAITGFPNIQDNCPQSINPVFTDIVNSGNCPAEFFLIRVWTAEDACHNVATCTQTILVADFQAPVVICPPNTTLNGTVTPNGCFATYEVPFPQFADNCSQAPVITTLMNGGAPVTPGATVTLLQGVTTFTYVVTDDCGNTVTCAFEVTVVCGGCLCNGVPDVTPPVIVNCPANISVNGGSTGATVTWPLPTATDNCQLENLTSTHASGAFFPCGLTTVVYTAADSCGNTSTCSFTVIVDCSGGQACACGGYTGLLFGPAGTAGVPGQSVACNQPFTVPCPVEGRDFTVSGQLACSGTPPGCQGNVSFWILYDAGNNAIGSGALNTGTSFSLIVHGNDIQTPGTYSLLLQGYCGNQQDGFDTCRCTLLLVVPECGNQVNLCGMAAISCFSGFIDNNPANGVADDIVLAIVDVRNHNSASPGANWETATDNKIMFPNWTSGNLGQIFGLDIDNTTQTIYAASTTLYGRYLPNSMPNSTFGKVYRINPVTGAIATVATLPQNTAAPAGLGDVWFDAAHNQLFVSNFYDGLVYRLDASTGLTLSTFDFSGNPGNTFANTHAGFVELGERVWAVAVYQNRLYFSVWNEDRLRNNGQIANEIWSIGLDTGTGDFSGAPVLEITMPVYNPPSSGYFSYSSPVSDIEFSSDGEMLVGEKTTNGDLGDAASVNGSSSVGNWAHFSRIFKFSGNSPANWGAGQLYYVGNYTNLSASAKQHHSNCAGGIDFGYESYDPATGQNPTLCDSMIWSTGDALRVEFPVSGWNGTTVVPIPTINAIDPTRAGEGTVTINDPTPNCGSGSTYTYTFTGTNDRVYGITGIRASGNSNIVSSPAFVANSSIYIDMDNIYIPCQLVKTQYGDLETFKCIACPSIASCDSICLADSLIINTGYDPVTGGNITPGQGDPLWTLVAVPPAAAWSVPRPAFVINPFSAWNMSLGSEWISGQPVANYSPDNCSADNCTCPPYLFQRCFCLCQDDSVAINFDILHDDRLFMNLVDQSNGAIIPIYDGCPSQLDGNYYHQVVRHVSTQLYLKAGRYCLEAHLFNTGGTAMGFSLEGAIQGVSIETDVCCNNTGSISGAKFHDKDCDRKRDISGSTFIDPGLPGWQIVLCDTTGNPIDTAITDVQGIYSFTNIPPGTYVVKEIQQPLWSPSTPAGGVQTVIVQPTGAVIVDFGNCSIPVTPCDSINAIAVKDTSKTGCCFDLTIDNQKANYFSSLEICVLNGGTLDNATANSGWSVQNPGASTAWLYPTGGIIPIGTQAVGEFCLDNLNADSQLIEIKYYGPNGTIVCRDTLVVRCESCVEILADPLVCKGRGKYDMTFCIQTGDNLDWNVNSIHIIAPAGVTVTPDILPLPNIPKGTKACSWTVSVMGALQPGPLCLTAVIHEQNILLEPELNCCSDTFCVEIPDCDPCDSSITYASYSPVVLNGGDCCFDITLHNFPDYFVAVNTQITTPGWEFGAINNSPSSGFIINTNTPPTSVWWDPTMMHNNYVPDGITLPTVCMHNTGGGVLPIDVLITWMAADQTICTYALQLDCADIPPPHDECVLLTSDSLICTRDTSYAYTFTVYNNSSLSKPPGFTAGQVTLYQVPAGGNITPSAFSAVIAPGNSQTFTTTVTGQAGDQICFYAVLHELNDDSLHINCCPTEDTICITLPSCGFQCPNNIVQNGDFQQGMSPGDLDGGGTASFWSAIPNSTPQVVLNQGCSQNGSILMWGNQVVGEGIRQNVNFSPGATYQLSLCGAFLNTVQPNARLRVRATNNASLITQSNYLPCALPDCEEIFLTPILGTGWASYTAPLWTPLNPYTNLVVTVWNNSNANDGAFVSWARVDDICIRPIQTGEPAQPQVLLFPNPATDQINLAFDAPLPAPATVRVLDMTGRVRLRAVEVPAGTELTSLDISSLTDGMYLADIEIRGVAALRKRFVVHNGGVQAQER